MSRVVGISLEWVLVFIIFLVFAIKSSAFQTWLAQRIAGYLSNELNAEVSIGKVDIDFFDYATLEDVLVRDLRGDTVVFAPKIHCDISYLSIREEKLRLSKVELVDPHLELKKYEGDKVWNYDFLEEYFSSDKPKRRDTTTKPWDVFVDRIMLTNTHLDYHNFNKPWQDFGVDFDHMAVRGLNASMSDFHKSGDTAIVHMDRLFLSENSGFLLDTLAATIKIHENYLGFDDLLIATANTRLRSPRLSFFFSDIDDFDDFEEKVKMEAQILPSKVYMKDISFFAPELEGFDRTIQLSGKVRGTVNELKIRQLDLALSDQTYIKGNIDLIQVTDFENVFIDAKIKEFSGTMAELATIPIPPFESATIDFPPRFSKIGKFKGRGSFTGGTNDFVAYTEVNTDVGSVKTDIRFYVNPKDGFFHYDGDLITNEFKAGYFYDMPELGNVSMKIDIKATGITVENLYADIQGDIFSLGFEGYNYSNIRLAKGKLSPDRFIGKLEVKDPNLKMNFDGSIVFGGKEPVFNFNLDVREAHPVQLNLSERDPSASLCFSVTADAIGSDIDVFEGRLSVTGVDYYEKGKEYHVDSIYLAAEQLPEKRKALVVRSDVMDGNITGKYNFEELPVAFSSVVANVLPALFDDRKFKLKNSQEFEYKFNIHNFEIITELFTPELIIPQAIALNGKFESESNIFTFRSDKIPSLTYADTKFSGLILNARNNADYLDVRVRSEQIVLSDGVTLKNYSLKSELYQNQIATLMDWDNKDGLNYGNVQGMGIVHSGNRFEFDINPSHVTVMGETWDLDASSHIAFSGDTVSINNFNIHNGNQTISVGGVISQNRNDKLNVDICNFDMRNINFLMSDTSIHLYGRLDAEGFVSDIYHDIIFASTSELDSFHVNEHYLGEFDLVNSWDNENKRILTTGLLSRNNIKSIQFAGSYHTKNKKEQLEYQLRFNETNLNFLNAFLPEDVSNLRGLANGTITLSGNVDQPKLKGKLDFQNGGIKVGMLNTEYFFGGIVSITEDMIAFDNIPISDIKGNLGNAQGTILHKNFENWNFNCLLEFNKMLCMNTTEEMNPLYFGRAFATGSLEVFAYGNNIEVTVNAKTEKGTRITLPLYGSSDQSIQDFVKFVDRDSIVTIENDKLDLSGITLNFDFDITPDAEVFIVFDKLAGDMMRGRGAGHLQMLIDPLGEFTMFGQYVIDQGDYLFTLMNVINKRFSVRKGSTISWYGDPMAADIDLKAVYKVMAAPTEIMAPDVAALYKRNMEVECEMTLRQNLFKPDVAFDIRIPKGDENVKTALNGIRSSGPELTRQFFALMAINKFLPLTNSISNASGNALSGGKSTVSEMISSQMSNWLSQISDEFDIGLNYRPGDEISSEEIAVAFSTQLLNDRLTVSTNVGVAKGNSANRNPNQLIGDFNVEYKINKDGTFRVRGYNESNEFDITRTAQAPFTQGVGVYYTEEFDKLSDVKLLRKIRSWFRKKEDYKHHDDNSESRVPDQKGEPCLAEEPRLQKK